jgi:hypothetical protein
MTLSYIWFADILHQSDAIMLMVLVSAQPGEYAPDKEW